MVTEEGNVEEERPEQRITSNAQIQDLKTKQPSVGEPSASMAPLNSTRLLLQDNKSASQGPCSANPTRNGTATKTEEESGKESEAGTRTLKDQVSSTSLLLSLHNLHLEGSHHDHHDVAAEMFLPACMVDDRLSHSLKTAMPRPPVTTETLNELNLQWIQNNINLRIDIHYDHDLHFTPVTGDRGEEKRHDAQQFWRALTTEFKVYQHDSGLDCTRCKYRTAVRPVAFQQRLPGMFLELQQLLLTLVPKQDCDEVYNNLDVDLLMQQVNHGALDVVKFSKWLASLLTRHCAPMRDEWAAEMVEKIRNGACEGDMVSIVAGLEKLFSFLEAMKLDVANHQIRTFRYPLIKDGISFQQDYFKTRIEDGKLDVSESREWFNTISQQREVTSGHLPKNINTLIQGIVQLCAKPDATIPGTLQHDGNRLAQLQDDFQDLIHLRICLYVFDQVAKREIGATRDLQLMHAMLIPRIMDLTYPDHANSHDSDSDNDTPNSNSKANDDAADCDPSIPSLWHTAARTISVEITRATYSIARSAGRTVIPDSAFRHTHDFLVHCLTNPTVKYHHTAVLAHALVAETGANVNIFNAMAPVEISEAQKVYQRSLKARRQGAGGGRVLSSASTARSADEEEESEEETAEIRTVPELEDMARRIAHLGVVHWRVWADLAYL